MPKPTVSDDSREYRTKKNVGHWEAGLSNESIGSEQNLNKLSFLHGATVDGGSNDMGADSDSFRFGWGDRDSYEARRKLRRHTVDQGMSTFSWPDKP